MPPLWAQERRDDFLQPRSHSQRVLTHLQKLGVECLLLDLDHINAFLSQENLKEELGSLDLE